MILLNLKVKLKSEILVNNDENSKFGIQNDFSRLNNTNLEILENLNTIEHDTNLEILENSSFFEHETMHICELSVAKPIIEVILNNKHKLSMEFDTGSQVSCCSLGTLEGSGMVSSSFLQHLSPSKKALKSANGMETVVLGKLNVKVQFNGQEQENLYLYIVKDQFPSLMGRSWIEQFLGRNWLHRLLKDSSKVKSVSSDKDGTALCSCVCNVTSCVNSIGNCKCEPSCLSKCESSKSTSDSYRECSMLSSCSSSLVCQNSVEDTNSQTSGRGIVDKQSL